MDKINNKLKMLIIFLILIIISCLSYIGYKSYTFKESNITIFIHGTFMPELAILSPYQTYYQKLTKEDLYSKSIKKIRNNSETYNDSLILEKGLNKINENTIRKYEKQSLNQYENKLGAYHIIGLYNNIYINAFKDCSRNKYYTFGFDGLLSNDHRKKSAKKLYKSLIKLIKEQEKKNNKMNINLVSFSHGGNVALYLALLEDQYHKKLKINNLILMGTPIQEETAHYATKYIFNKVINIYSESDSIQLADIISTNGKKSYRRITDLIIKNKPDIKYNNIFNIRLLANNNPNSFEHSNFWCLGKYECNNHLSKLKNTILLETLNPFPLVIFVPYFIKIIEKLYSTKSEISNLDVSFKIKDKQLILQALHYPSHAILYESNNLNNIINKAKEYLSNCRKPYCNDSEMTKILRAFWLALKD